MKPPVINPGGYYSTVYALTAKESVLPGPGAAAVVNNTPLAFLFSPLLIYGSVILFFVLFLGAIFIQLFHRVLDLKRTLTTLVVVVVISSMPYVLKTTLEVTSLQTRAGPDETPHNLVVKQMTNQTLFISWETQVEKSGAIRIGPAPLTETTSKVVISNLGKKVTQHQVTLKDLTAGVDYEIEILSGTRWYNDKGKPMKIRLTAL